ncbi:hypothetical protein L484_023005 [Morus notabilis]|uniref:Uncharacterized protein n=1 Tax=Morus notabilis TaxID=981085 RepID=W9RT92_9ROSA|nr:hypothetical protein L484_023005 [Morus notabilis]
MGSFLPRVGKSLLQYSIPNYQSSKEKIAEFGDFFGTSPNAAAIALHPVREAREEICALMQTVVINK